MGADATQHARLKTGENCLQNNEQPFTHTIAYAMRGLLEIGVAAQREICLMQHASSVKP